MARQTLHRRICAVAWPIPKEKALPRTKYIRCTFQQPHLHFLTLGSSQSGQRAARSLAGLYY